MSDTPVSDRLVTCYDLEAERAARLPDFDGEPQVSKCATVSVSRSLWPIDTHAPTTKPHRYPYIMLRPGFDGVVEYIPFSSPKKIKKWMRNAEPGDSITIVVATYED